MAKKIDIVQAFVWAGNILDTQNLTVPEQAVLFNLLKLINRNFWSPIKISAFKLSRTMGSDTRTVQKALQKLKEKQIIFMEGENIYIATIPEQQFKSLIGKPVNKQTDSANDNSSGNTAPNSATSPRIDATNPEGNKTLADF